MKCAIVPLLFTGAAAFAPASTNSQSKVVLADSKGDLTALAEQANPIVKYYDPLSLADADFWGQGTDVTIGFLRHAEIKHGRIAMAAFVGYCVQSNFVWPWP